MEQSIEQLTEIFERLSDVKSCKLCDRPVLLPQLESKEDEHNQFYEMCFQCAKKNYPTISDGPIFTSFFENLRNILNLYPQPLIIYDEILQGADFSGINLNSSAFINCDLTLSNFRYSDLTYCNFLGSILNNALFANATLLDACMLGCNADYTYIESANLSRVLAGLEDELLKKVGPFIKSEWIRKVWEKGPRRDYEQKPNKRSLNQKWAFSGRESVLRASDLTGAKFFGADLNGTSLEYTRLQESDFSFAQLQDSSLSHASLGDTSFFRAQLTRADISATFTPDPGSVDQIHQASVSFDGAELTGALLCNCYFLKASFSEVQAQRIDCRSIMLGPGSSLSGDFSNSRFNYAHLVGCTFGRKEDPINLRDSDFSHSHFIEVSIHAIDLDTSCFSSSRFEGRKEYKPLSYVINAVRNDRKELILSILKTYKEPKPPNKLIGHCNGDKGYITPAAMNFEKASLGNIHIDGVSFLTANFSNSELILTAESKCAFDSSNFDNAFIILPSNTNIKHPLFRACSFHNAVIAERAMRQIMSIYVGCAFNSTAFRRVDKSDILIEHKANAVNFKFVNCTFERTPLDSYFFNTLGYLVLKNCRLLDGQYLGLYKPGTGKRRESERRTLEIIENIVDRTVKFKDYSDDQNNGNIDKEFADQQYLWNMFATNYRTLAIPGLESDCLVRLRDLDLYFYKLSDQDSENRRWYKAILKTFIPFIFYLMVSAILAGSIGKMTDEFIGKKLVQSLVGAFILCIPIIRTIRLNYREKVWPVWSKAIYHYGEKPAHAFGTWMLVILIFGLFHWVTGLLGTNILKDQFDIKGSYTIFATQDGSINYVYSLLNCIYFSTVTFTTLGFGDLQPLHLTKLYTAIEACIGATMMALFVLSFARRTAAR